MKKTVLFFISVVLIISALCNVSFANETYGHVYCRSETQSKRVALTFDDGPHPRYTEQILDILEEYGIRATFFIIGVNAENYPESLQKIVDSGCEIGNHTYSHVRLTGLSEDEIEKEIKKCENVLYDMTGKRPTVFRPPQGFISDNLLPVVSRNGYNIALWSIDTLDWSLNRPDRICATVTKNLRGGDIILMHDYVSGGNTTCDALKRFIPQLLSEGYEFVTVSELIS